MMDTLLATHSSLVNQLRRERANVAIESITKLFDQIIDFLNTTDCHSHGLQLLATVSHELASIHTLALFDNLNIMNHPLFMYMRCTFEMLLTKSYYLKNVKMSAEEEECFYALSYLIVNLCLYRNETLVNFYTQSTIKHPR